MKALCRIRVVVLLALLMTPAVAPAQFTFTTNNGAITITGYTGPGGIVEIPSTINGLPVISIGTNAFDSVSSLINVNIPDSVTNIGFYAFHQCTSLTNVALGTNLIAIGGGAFVGCKLRSIAIPNSLTTIGSFAFYFNNLTGVTIGTNVTSIGDGAFSGCNALIDISVYPLNPGFKSAGGILFNKSQTTLVQYPGGIAGSYTIPNSVTNIENDAFYGCTKLTDVMLGTNVTCIGDFAFEFCTSLTNVVIPNSVNTIGLGPFANCTALKAILVDSNNPAYTNIAGILFSKSQTTLVQYPAGITRSSYTIPNGVTNIGNWAFAFCYYMLSSVTIGNNVTSIGDYAFSGCWLTSVTIPNSVITIGDSAFYRCTSLGSVTLGTNLTSIGDSAYAQCSKLTRVIIPNSVTSIGNGAFLQCSSLTDTTIGNSVISIGNYSFESCTSLASIVIPNSVASIGRDAFNYCPSLTGVYFRGDSPTPANDVSVFNFSNPKVYYLPGTTSWGLTFDGCPTMVWFLPNPLILNQSPGFGVQTNQFGFTISWATNTSVVTEASTNLVNPVWVPVATNALVNGTNIFSDPNWTNYPNRFYRIRSP